MNQLLIIGGASIDTLHLKDSTETTAGGVGMYTAMAAHRCGVQVSMLSPRPVPCLELLQPVARRLSEWLGPVIAPDQLPRFEISYRHGKTEYLDMFFGAASMDWLAMLPDDLSKYDLIHVAQKSEIAMQLALIQTCRERGAKLISAGTYPADAANNPEIMREIIAQADIFFMNKREATAVFDSVAAAVTNPGKILYITLGKEGACIIQGDASTCIAAVPTRELDPTGAGDTFCGAALAHLSRQEHPIMAARHAVALSAEMITQIGPAALFSDDPPPRAEQDPRVQVNEEQVRRVAGTMRTLDELSVYPFISPVLPPAGHPQALDYFFAATFQQFSFWTVRDNQYALPLISKIGGVELKGSDYLWEAYRRKLEQDPAFFSPERQANLSREEMLQLFRDDQGDDPMPALDLHLQQAHAYGRDMLALQLTPRTVLDKALASSQPLQTFLLLLDHIGGYKEDPLRKKSNLLAAILSKRPENFLSLRHDELVRPIVDYHLLRSSLRLGLIDVLDEDLYQKLSGRQLVSAAEEWAVRFPVHQALHQIDRLSGKGSQTDYWFFSNARQRCPEMSEPQCHICRLDDVCAHRREMFQPVLRTTFY